MDDEDSVRLPYDAFRFGCELTALVLGQELGLISDGKILELLQAVADGDETLLESPSDTAAWYQRQLKDREQIVAQLGEAFFENMTRYAESVSKSDFASARNHEMKVAMSILTSLHGGVYKKWEPPTES